MIFFLFRYNFSPLTNPPVRNIFPRFSIHISYLASFLFLSFAFFSLPTSLSLSFYPSNMYLLILVSNQCDPKKNEQHFYLYNYYVRAYLRHEIILFISAIFEKKKSTDFSSKYLFIFEITDFEKIITKRSIRKRLKESEKSFWDETKVIGFSLLCRYTHEYFSFSIFRKFSFSCIIIFPKTVISYFTVGTQDISMKFSELNLKLIL